MQSCISKFAGPRPWRTTTSGGDCGERRSGTGRHCDIEQNGRLGNPTPTESRAYMMRRRSTTDIHVPLVQHQCINSQFSCDTRCSLTVSHFFLFIYSAYFDLLSKWVMCLTFFEFSFRFFFCISFRECRHRQKKKPLQRGPSAIYIE